MALTTHRSLASRIFRAIAVTLLLLVAAMVVAAHLIDAEIDRTRAEAQLTAIAEIIANRSAAAVLFRDLEAAERNLSVARFHPDVRGLCLYTRAGHLLASYRREDSGPTCEKAVAVPVAEVRIEQLQGVLRPFAKTVRARGGVAGYLLVDATLESVAVANRRFALALGSLFFVIGVITFVVVRLIVKQAFRPLASLRDTVSEISQNPYSSARATHVSDDEVGDLVYAFNQMLDRLEEKDDAVKRSEKAVRETQTMRALSQLSGGIAHDFNNILAIGLSGVEVLELKLPKDGELASDLEAVKAALMRGASLTRNLAGLSKGMPHSVQRVDVNEALQGMQDMLERAVVPSVDAGLELGEDVGSIEIDLGDLQDALLNLVINAKDVMPEGGNVSVRTARCVVESDDALAATLPGSGTYVRISVTDDGPGIPAELQSRIFEPFFSTKGAEHSGLGLAMVYGLVDRAGGRVLIDSVPGIGTTFNLYIPQAGPMGAVSSTKPDEGVVRGGPETVLLVDDEVLLLSSIKALLESLGYRVLVASEPAEVLNERVLGESIDAVISDVVMPGGMSGFEMVDAFRARYDGEFVTIFVSGYMGEQGEHLPQCDEGVAVLTKPVSGRKLATELRKLLDARGVQSPPALVAAPEVGQVG